MSVPKNPYRFLTTTLTAGSKEALDLAYAEFVLDNEVIASFNCSYYHHHTRMEAYRVWVRHIVYQKRKQPLPRGELL